MEDSEVDQVLARKIVGLTRTPTTGGQQVRLISKLSDDIAITDYFTWADDKEIFNRSTSHLCRFLNKA